MGSPETEHLNRHSEAIEVLEGTAGRRQDTAAAIAIEIQAVGLARTTGDQVKLAEYLGSLSRMYRRMARQTGNDTYLQRALETSAESVNVADEIDDPRAKMLPYRDRASALAAVGRFDDAAAHMEQAIAFFGRISEIQWQRSVLGELQIHLAEYHYQNAKNDGDKLRVLQELERIVADQDHFRLQNKMKADGPGKESEHDFAVRVMGGLLAIARFAVRTEREKEGRAALQKAREILAERNDLPLRKEDLDEVEALYVKS